MSARFMMCCFGCRNQANEKKIELEVKKELSKDRKMDDSLNQESFVYQSNDITIIEEKKEILDHEITQNKIILNYAEGPMEESKTNLVSMEEEEIVPPNSIIHNQDVEQTTTTPISEPPKLIEENKEEENPRTFTLGDHPDDVSSNNQPEVNGNTEISAEFVRNHKKLILEVLEGTSLSKGLQININAAGHPDSKRRAKDGIVYFGNGTPDHGHILNDFEVPLEEEGFGKRHFMINFNKKDNNYYLKDLNDGTGTFIKVDGSLILKHCYIISFGDSHLVVQFMETKAKIVFKFLEGPKSDSSYAFTPTDSPITIGRTDRCSIRIKNHTLSRIQCKVEYKNENWWLVDGDGTKRSTNGTWLFAEDPFKIFNNMSFKAGQTLFLAKINK